MMTGKKNKVAENYRAFLIGGIVGTAFYSGLDFFVDPQTDAGIEFFAIFKVSVLTAIVICFAFVFYGLFVSAGSGRSKGLVCNHEITAQKLDNMFKRLDEINSEAQAVAFNITSDSANFKALMVEYSSIAKEISEAISNQEIMDLVDEELAQLRKEQMDNR
jgi:uncharacterized membrane protein